MKMVYASRWMLDALASAGQPKTVLLNLPALLNTLSADDVALYVSANKNLVSFLPAQIVNSFMRVDWDLQGAELKSVRDAIQRLDIAGKIIIPDDADNLNLYLTSDLCEADVIVFQHILREDRQEGPFRIAHITERLIRQLYTALRYEQLIVLPVFRWYMEARQNLLIPNRIV